MGEVAMKTQWQGELEAAIRSDMPLNGIVSLLREYKKDGLARDEAYSFLEGLRAQVSDEALEDRILEVADFVAGFCSPHMAIWEGDSPSAKR
jgi:hypothetical protein